MAQTATMTETKTVEPETVVDEETINEINSPFSVENLQKQVDTVHNLLKEGNDNNLWTSPAADPNVVEWLSKIDEATIQLGLGVEYLAETKFGAPTDLDIKTLSDDREKELEGKLADLNKQYDEVIAEQSQLYREAIAFDDKRDRMLREALANNGLTRETHPVMTERWAALEENDPEVWEVLEKIREQGLAKTNEATAARIKANKIYQDRAEIRREHYENDPIPEAYRKRNEATLAALKEMGVEMAEADDIQFSKDSHKKAVASVKAIVHHYPKTWVDNSNARMDTNPLRAKDSKGRAHYNDNTYQKKRVTKASGYIVQKPEGWIPDPLNDSEIGYVPVDADGSYTDEYGQVHHGEKVEGLQGFMHIRHEIQAAYVPQGETKPPARRGYELREIHDDRYNRDTQKFDRVGKKWVYLKPEKRITTDYSQMSSELTVSHHDGQSRINTKAVNTRVALHELGHRMEASNQHVVQMERAFLLRRGGYMNNAPEKLTSINGRTKERGYKDNFVNHYMGRVYQGKSYEILTMGMESIFEGTQGGLTGSNNTHADADYKRAILGMLATGAKKY